MSRQCVLILAAVMGLCVSAVGGDGREFAFNDHAERGELTLSAGDNPVLSFVYKPRLKDGVDEKYRRAGYIHPLYDLDGHAITKDFPKDHYHHRGVWLSWPLMWYEGRKVQLWHPSPLKQVFDRVIQKEARSDRAVLVLQNNWVLDGKTIGRARWHITVHRADNEARWIDLKLTLHATEKPIKLQGKRNKRKGYGGLCVRSAAALAKGRLLTSKGPLTGDAVQESFKWADLSTDTRGLSVLAHPDNPNSPPPWLLRNSYGGVMNPEWPGLEKVTLAPDKPVTLRYRLGVHRGKMNKKALDRAFRQWAGE